MGMGSMALVLIGCSLGWPRAGSACLHGIKTCNEGLLDYVGRMLWASWSHMAVSANDAVKAQLLSEFELSTASRKSPSYSG